MPNDDKPTGIRKRRWRRELTEEQIRRMLRQRDNEICEWEVTNHTFLMNRRLCMIVRTNALGADVFHVHGGWFYANSIELLADWQEIKDVAANTRVIRGNQNN